MAEEIYDISSKDVNKRIILFMETQGFKLSEFADYLGIPRSRMTHIKNGRNKPNLEFIVKLLNKFPNLNPEWLLLGKGSMFKVPPHQADKESKKDKDSELDTLKTGSEDIVNEEVASMETLAADSASAFDLLKDTQQSQQPAQENQSVHTAQGNNTSPECSTTQYSDNQQSGAQQQAVYNQPHQSQAAAHHSSTPQNQIPPQGQPVVVPGPNGQPAQILILYPDHTFVAYRARE